MEHKKISNLLNEASDSEFVTTMINQRQIIINGDNKSAS